MHTTRSCLAEFVRQIAHRLLVVSYARLEFEVADRSKRNTAEGLVTRNSGRWPSQIKAALVLQIPQPGMDEPVTVVRATHREQQELIEGEL